MPLNKQLANKIKDLLLKIIRKKLSSYNPETRSMPFHYKLLGKDRMALFSFIHSVNTMLGQSVFEQIGKLIAEPGAERAVAQYKEMEGYISTEAVLVIDKIIRDLRTEKRKPNKQRETLEVLKASREGDLREKLKRRVDLFVKTRAGDEYYFEIKTAKPNINEFSSIKKQLLEWIAMRGSQSQDVLIKTILAIPYNPYEPKPYERWTLQGLFDLEEELLVGKEFWDFLGQKGTYEDLLLVFEEAGKELSQEIDKKTSSF